MSMSSDPGPRSSSSSVSSGSGPIVVGVDGSANAGRALAVAADLALGLDTDVVAVHALGLLTVIGDRRLPSVEHRAEIDDHLHEVWCTPLADRLGDRWSARLIDGNPADVLIATATDVAARMVVVGARGVGGHPDLMLGSTSHQVIHHATCPTVVVPPIDRSAATVLEAELRDRL